jgi:hypothetical protein
MGNYLSYQPTIDKTSASTIIRTLSIKYNKTSQMKRDINNKKSECGQGCIFIGKNKEDSSNLRMLVGAHYSKDGKLKIGVFGGNNDAGELVIDTVIREAIEEIFNFIPTIYMIRMIRNYLNDNPDLYFIFQLNNNSNSYSYIFDVDILGTFVDIINNREIKLYLSGSIFNLNDFMINRQITTRRRITGLDEIKYLSFTSLNKLVEGGKKYELFNYYTHTRETLEYKYIFIRVLQSQVIKDIL